MMNLLSNIISERLINALGWTLLHSLWQGAAVAVGLLLVLFFMRRNSSQTRYYAGILALVLVVGLAGVTFIGAYGVGESSVPASGTAAIVSGTAISGTIESGTTPTTLGAMFSQYFNRHLPLIVTLWMLGVLVFMLKLAGGYLYNQRLKVYQVIEVPKSWRRRMQEFCGKLNLEKPIKLMESARVKVPVAIGHLKPVILFPVGMLTGMPREQVEALLAHELAHIARKDYLVNLFQAVADVLFFYHPAVRWISNAVRSERENCCDDIAVALSGNSLAVARALTNIQESSYPDTAPAMAAVGHSNRLLGRVKRLLNPKRKNSGRSDGFVGVSVLTILFLFMVTGLYSALPTKHYTKVNTANQFTGDDTGAVGETGSSPDTGAVVGSRVNQEDTGADADDKKEAKAKRKAKKKAAKKAKKVKPVKPIKAKPIKPIKAKLIKPIKAKPIKPKAPKGVKRAGAAERAAAVRKARAAERVGEATRVREVKRARAAERVRAAEREKDTKKDRAARRAREKEFVRQSVAQRVESEKLRREYALHKAEQRRQAEEFEKNAARQEVEFRKQEEEFARQKALFEKEAKEMEKHTPELKKEHEKLAKEFEKHRKEFEKQAREHAAHKEELEKEARRLDKNAARIEAEYEKHKDEYERQEEIAVIDEPGYEREAAHHKDELEKHEREYATLKAEAEKDEREFAKEAALHKEELEKREKEYAEMDAEAERNEREFAKEAKAMDSEMDIETQRMREEDERIREEVAVMDEEAEGMEEEEAFFKNLQEELVKDRLINLDKNYRFEYFPKKLLINGVKQSKKVTAKYRKILKAGGHKMNRPLRIAHISKGKH
ncbi:MAG: M48 family metalloprotease [bacterium]|nr:M48 family metalloprotease [bacterium]